MGVYLQLTFSINSSLSDVLSQTYHKVNVRFCCCGLIQRAPVVALTCGEFPKVSLVSLTLFLTVSKKKKVFCFYSTAFQMLAYRKKKRKEKKTLRLGLMLYFFLTVAF